MLPLDIALTLINVALASGALTGVLVRDKARPSLLFLMYLVSVAMVGVFGALWPTRFWDWAFWAAGGAVQAALRIGVAFEITHKTFRVYPRAYARVRVLVALALLVVLLVVVTVPRRFGDAYELARVIERASYGTGFLFLAYLGTARYYGIPLDPFHRAIATGFGIITVLVGSASLLWRFDPAFGLGRDFIVKTAYPCVLAWWLVSAWRRDDFSDLSPETLRRIHPWRVR